MEDWEGYGDFGDPWWEESGPLPEWKGWKTIAWVLALGVPILALGVKLFVKGRL